MKIITNDSIHDALAIQKRVYLCGILQNHQELKHIENSGLEIGISRYSSYTADAPHLHTYNDEYNIIMRGKAKVYVFSEKKEYILKKGDVFLIAPNMPYAFKAQANTEVLFVKYPGGNDKQLIQITPSITHWMSTWKAKMKI